MIRGRRFLASGPVGASQHGIFGSPSVQFGGSLAGKDSRPASSVMADACRVAQQQDLSDFAFIERCQQIVEESD